MPTRPNQGDPAPWGTLLNQWLDVAHNDDGTIKFSPFDERYVSGALDVDSLLAANSDVRVASQKAIKTYVGLVGLNNTTAKKTVNYVANSGEFVPVDVTAGNVTVTLPSNPPDMARVGVKMVAQDVLAVNTVSVVRPDAGVFNRTGGPTTLTLSLLNQGVILQYQASTGLWYVQVDDLDLAQLDIRYRDCVNVLSFGATGSGITDDYTAITHAQMAALILKKWLYFPYGANGIYLISQGLTVSSHEKWWGDGTQDVQIKYNGPVNGIVVQCADSTQVTSYVQLRDLNLNGNNLADYGLYMPSCQEWKTFNVQAINCKLAPLKIYGQRTATGALNPADSTYNKFYNFRGIGGAIAGAWLTGTKARTSTTTTLSSTLANSGTVVTVVDTSAFPAAPGVILIDDEWIAYAGKTGTTFTGCTRGYWDSIPARHASGATVGVAARVSGGASNLNEFFAGRFASQTKNAGAVTISIASPAVFTQNNHGLQADDPVYFETTGALPTGLTADTVYYVMSTNLTTNTFQVSATNSGASPVNTSGAQSGTHTLFRARPARGVWFEQGAANYFAQPVGNLTDGEGFHFAWYSNCVVGGVVENTGQLGKYQLGFDETAAECHDNWVFGVHNGGGGTSLGLYPVINKNTVVTEGALSRVYGEIYGEIDSAGNIVRGSGFTAVRNSAGNYTITFTQLPAVPVVVATPTGATARHCNRNTVTSSSVVLLTFDATGAAADAGVTFVIKVPA